MADIFLNVGESITFSPFANSRYFGNTGAETVGLTAAAVGATVSQNIEGVTLPGTAASYTYQQQGNQLVVFSGATRVATITLQADADGTRITFANGAANATVSATGMVLGGQTVPSAAPGVVVPTLDPVVGGVVTLTRDADTVSGNVINAPRTDNRGGTDQVNSLNDDDVLNGTGTDASLTFDFVNDADTGDQDIVPTLTNIKTVSVKFSTDGAGGVASLDLQDADATVDVINISRIDSDLGIASVNNLIDGVSKITVTDSNAPSAQVEVLFTGAGTAADKQSTAVELNNVQIANLRIESDVDGNAGGGQIAGSGIETITLTSGKSPNVVGVLTVEDLETLNINGTQNLTLGRQSNVTGAQGLEAVIYNDGLANVGGSLTKIDAGTFTGKLDLALGNEFQANLDGTSGTGVVLNVIGGAGDDTFRLVGSVVAGGATPDLISGGAGKNTVVVSAGTTVTAGGTAAAPVANITSVQALEVRGGHDDGSAADVVSIDANAFNALATIFVRNEGATDQAVGVGADTIAGTADDTLLGGADTLFVSTTENLSTTLLNLTAPQASAISIAHGTTGNNGTAQNLLSINLKDASATTDLVTVAIVEGVNNNPRFNAVIGTQNAPLLTGGVENVTLVDADSESNTIALSSMAQHTGTLTVGTAAGVGVAGTFLNLDTNGTGTNGGLFGWATTGLADLPTSFTATGRLADMSLTAGQLRFGGATFTAAAEVGNVVVRVNTNNASAVGAQTITGGAGNDTIIFDNVPVAGDTRAGLTISDVVKGGAGSDTLAIDGHNVAITLGASEWTNVSEFETIRVIGNGVAANNGINQTNSYNLTLTNNLLAANKDANGFLNIISDNDAFNNTGRTAAEAAAVTVTGGNDASISSGGVTIDARTLSAGSKWSYKGNEGVAGLSASTGASSDRLILADANIDGNAVLDGGANDNITNNRGTNTTAGNGIVANTGNLDILEVRNAAVVSQGDLANVKNFGTLSFTNDTAITQSSVLQLNDAIVDNLVDSFQTSTSRTTTASATNGANVEVLVVNAIDNVNVAAATQGLTIEAASLTDRSDLAVTLGRGLNNVTTGGGQDNVVLLGNYVAGTYGAGLVVNGVNINAQSTPGAVARVVTDVINLGTGIDTLTTYGAINLAGATLTGVENIVANSVLVISAAQFRAIVAAGGTVSFNGNSVHQLRIIGDGGAALDLTKVVLNGGSLVYDVRDGGGVNNATTGAPVDNSGTGDPAPGMVETNASDGAIVTLAAGGSFTGTAGVNNTFQGNQASLNGTTVTGTAADTEVLQITDALTVQLGNGTTGGTITNIDTLLLANAANNVSFAAGTGITQVTGNAGNDAVNIANLAANASVSLGLGTDTLTLDNVTRTGTLNGGDGTDGIVLTAATNLSGATITAFETMTGNFAATLTRAQYGALAVTNTAAVTFSDAGAVTLQTTAPVAVLANGTNTVTATGAANFNVTGGTGDDTVNFGAALTAGDTFAAGTGNDVLQITGAATGSAAITGVETIQVNFAAPATFTTGAIAPGVASTITAAGSTAAVTIDATAYVATTKVTFVDGAGNDILTVGGGSDAQRALTTVTLSTGGADQVTLANGAFNGTTTNAATFNSFGAGAGLNADQVLGLGITTYQTVTAAGTAVTAANSLVEIHSAAALATTFDAGDAGSAENAIDTALGNYGGADGSSFYAIVYGTGGQTGNAALYQVNVTTAATGVTAANTAIELIATFNTVTADAFIQSNFL